MNNMDKITIQEQINQVLWEAVDTQRAKLTQGIYVKIIDSL